MGFGPPPVSPFVYTTPDDSPQMTVTIPYDNTTKALLTPITVHREVGCPWSAFVVWPGTVLQLAFPAAVGDSTIPLSSFVDAGISSQTDLENAGYTAT